MCIRFHASQAQYQCSHRAITTIQPSSVHPYIVPYRPLPTRSLPKCAIAIAQKGGNRYKSKKNEEKSGIERGMNRVSQTSRDERALFFSFFFSIFYPKSSLRAPASRSSASREGPPAADRSGAVSRPIIAPDPGMPSTLARLGRPPGSSASLSSSWTSS